VFAGAVVVDLAGFIMGTDQAEFGIPISGHLWPTAKISVCHAQIIQPRANAVCVDRRALVGCAGQRELFRGQMRACAAFQKRERLDHLA
jgi:hypothetical protein